MADGKGSMSVGLNHREVDAVRSPLVRHCITEAQAQLCRNGGRRVGSVCLAFGEGRREQRDRGV
jgi:hypothetical protein